MVHVWEVPLGDSMQHVLGGGRGAVPMVVFRGRCARVVLRGLDQGRRLCIRRGVGESAVRENVAAFGGELEDYASLRLLLWGQLVKFALWPVEGALVVPSPAVVGEEAEHGVLLRVFHILHVRRHVHSYDAW